MAELSATDLRAALEFVAEAGSHDDLDSFRCGILPGLQRLVPSDLVGYNEVEPGGAALVVTYPEPLESTAEPLARLAHQHPLISVQMNGDGRTYKISDFLATREFRALELYAELYHGIGAEDQIAFGLPGATVIGVAMNRDRRSFSERDRALLDLLRPHLAQTHRRLLERRSAEALVEALSAGLAEHGTVAIRLDATGGIAAAPASALELLQGYFPDGGSTALPAAVASWLGRVEAVGPGAIEPPSLAVGTERGALTISSAQLVDGERLLILEEQPAIRPERLRALGLTARQAEVLALLAAGLAAAEIAHELILSPATVRKHLEHIYVRLGVHSRAEAIAVAKGMHESAPERL